MLKFLSFKTSKDSHVLKFLWPFTNFLFWLLFVLWSILISFGLFFHFYLIPNIDRFRPTIESSISQILNTKFQIGSISTVSNGFFPSIEFLDVSNTDNSGETKLHIKRALASISAPSIFRFTLDKLFIDDCQVTVTKTKDGFYEVAGITLNSNNNSALSDSFFSIRDVIFNSAHLSWKDPKNELPPFDFKDIDLSIKNGIREHQFRLDATPSSTISERINFRAQFKQPLLSLHPGQWSQWSGQVYAQTPYIKFSDPLFSLLPFSNVHLQDGEGWIRIWSEIANGSIQKNLTDFDFKNIRLHSKDPSQSILISSIAGRLNLLPWKSGYEFKTEHLLLSLSGQSDAWDLSNYRLALSDFNDPFGPDSEGEFNLLHNSFDHLNKLTSDFLPKSYLNKLLSSLNLKGDIEEVKLAWGGSTFAEPTSSLKYTLPSWIEGSKKLFNRFSNSKRSNNTDNSTANTNATSSSLPFSQIKHFRVEGTLSGLDRSIPSIDNGLFHLPNTSSTKSPLALPLATKSFNTANETKESFSSIPHFKGLSAKFSFTEKTGSAHFSIHDGYLELPGALEQPIIEVKTLSSTADWSISNGEIDFHLSNTALSNSNGDASLDVKWFNPDVTHLSLQNLGDIDLDAQVNSLEATALYKYLPLSIGSNVRNYLKEAITSGTIQKTKIKLKGPLETFPFKNEAQGHFSISARLNKIGFNYFPKAFFKSPSLTLTDWPIISDLQGEFQMKERSLSLFSNFSNLGFDLNTIQLNKLEVKIADLSDPFLEINSDSKGSMQNYLNIFNRTSLSSKLGRPLEQSKAKGLADLKLKLSLPLLQIDRSKVLGNLTFNNNDVWLNSDTPVFFRTRGAISFTESTLTLQNVQTHTLGGESKLEGGYRPLPFSSDNALVIRAAGNFSAEGLERTCEIPFLSKFSYFVKGQSNYASTITIKKSGIPEISISSNLQGLSLGGPGFLKKSAESSLSFTYDTNLIREMGANHFLERQSIVLGDQLALRLFKDSSTNQSALLSGSMLISPLASSAIQQILPPNTSNLARPRSSGWSVNVTIPDIQLDDWQSALNGLYSSPSKSFSCNHLTFDSNSSDNVNKLTLDANPSISLPSFIKLQADNLNTQGRDFHAVNLIANREGNNWSANLDSREVNGNVKFLLDTEPSLRRISAHLNQFNINPIKHKTVDPLLSNDEPFFPWFDVVIDNLQVKEHPLGRVEFEAHNALNSKGSRFWRLNNIQLSNPDATLKATASWSPSNDSLVKGTQSQIDLSLDISNSGFLLSRLGTPGVVKDGKGNLKGQLSWKGSLINPDFETLSGNFLLDLEKGQFLKTDPGASRLLGVLNLQALPRRLTLDFKDLFGEGFAFDLFKGDIDVKDGTASTKNLIMKGVAGTVLLEGSANIGLETQDLRVVVVPEINAGTASLIYSTVNPIVGLTSFLAQYVIRQPLIQANTRTFHISGSWSDPQVTKIEIPIENMK
jgi:uncharacterized protein (TIGR02099 family)